MKTFKYFIKNINQQKYFVQNIILNILFLYKEIQK